MSLLSNLFKKPVPILTEENQTELLKIKREAYMIEARKIMEEKGKLQAQTDLGIKKVKEPGF